MEQRLTTFIYTLRQCEPEGLMLCITVALTLGIGSPCCNTMRERRSNRLVALLSTMFTKDPADAEGEAEVCNEERDAKGRGFGDA